MTRKIKWAVLSSLAAFAFTTANAQMTLTGEIKPRTEFRHGYQNTLDSAQNGSLFTSQRTRLNFGYSTDKFKTMVTIQDIRTWGSQSQLVSSYTPAPTFLHEGWAQYWFFPKFSIKAGRQSLAYDDERLFGPTDWQMQGRAHDLLLFIFEDTASKCTIHAGVAYNQDKESNTAIPYSVTKSYKEMEYLWLNKKFGPLGASLLFVNNGNQSPVSVTSTRYFQTVGTHIEYKKNKLFASGRFYYQFGEDANKKDMNAWMAGADIQYNITDKIMLGLGTEMMTGQSQTDTTKSYTDVNHVFNTLYGTGHKFNGYMDYYFAGSAHGNVGLNDIYFKARYKDEKLLIGLDIHQFMAAADVLDVQELLANGKYTAMDSNLGTEIDLTLGYAFSKLFTAQFGYSHYLSTETIAYLKGATNYKGEGYTDETSNWVYLMFTFKPNFLK